MTRKSFEIALKKGSLAENLIRRRLEAKGFIVYYPVTDGAHCFDFMAIHNKRRCIAMDVKCKAMMKKWPITGVNLKHYEDYKEFSQRHNMDFWIVFVDEHEKMIYGNTLQRLESCEFPIDYPRQINNIVYWPRSAMLNIGKLDSNTANKMKALSQRNYEYD